MLIFARHVAPLIAQMVVAAQALKFCLEMAWPEQAGCNQVIML